MKMYEGVVIQTYAKEADRKQKAEKESLQGVEKIIPIMCKANGKK